MPFEPINPAQNMLAGMQAVSEFQKNQQERERIRLEALNKFRGLEGPATASYSLITQQAPQPQDSPLAGPQPGVPMTRDQGAVRSASQSLASPQPVPAAPMAAPPPPTLQLPAGTPVTPGPAPMLPQQQPAAPAYQVDPHALEAFRQDFRRKLNTPGFASQTFGELQNMGFDSLEARQLLGYGQLTPQLLSKIVSMASEGPVESRQYAQGTDTADYQSAQDADKARIMYGQRGVSPIMEGALPPRPADYQEAVQNYGPAAGIGLEKVDAQKDIAELKGRMATMARQFKDQRLDNLNRQITALGMMGELVTPEQVRDVKGQSIVRSAALSYAMTGMDPEAVKQTVRSSAIGRQYADIINADPSLMEVTPTGMAAGGGMPAPAPLTAPAAPAAPKVSKGRAVAPATAPEDIRKNWSRIDRATQDEILEASQNPGFTGWDSVRQQLPSTVFSGR